MDQNGLGAVVSNVKDKIAKPHEYQILLPYIGVGVAVQYILNNIGIEVRDVPSEMFSESVIYASLITAGISIYNYSRGKIDDPSSKAKVDSIILGFSQNGDVLRGACNMLYKNGKLEKKIKDPEKTKKHQRELKYTYLAKILIAAHILRGETGPCFDCFKEVCSNWNNSEIDTYCSEDSEQIKHYKKIFKKALKHLIEVEGFEGDISADNISLLVEIINTLEDFYDEQFVEFAHETGSPFSTVEEGIAVSQLTVKTEVDTLNFLKERARNRKAFVYLLCTLSALSLSKTEGIEALEWVNNYFIKDIIDFFAANANAIIGTTVAYISARALGTVNTNNILAKYISKRLSPDTRKLQILDEK